MQHLNYSHLRYFWTIAREGSIARAAEILHVTPQTISGQLKLMEESLGHRLFDRVGRGLVLSEMGTVVFGYADEIFNLGAELTNAIRGSSISSALLFNVGIVNSVPKIIAERVIAPAFGLDREVRISCNEASMDVLLGRLATNQIDLVISDQPMPAGLSLQAYNHQLGESALSFFASRTNARKLKSKFPASLDGAPILLPARTTELRRRLDEWFYEKAITPKVVAEIDDSALMKAFGQAGVGVFVAPSAIEEEICTMYRSTVIGRSESITEHYYAISPERKLRHPAVVEITETARAQLFA